MVGKMAENMYYNIGIYIQLENKNIKPQKSVSEKKDLTLSQ